MKYRIKELRKKLNLTQDAFGKSIGMTRSNVCNIESGAVNLLEKNIDKICEKYNVNVEWLRNGTGEMFSELAGDEELAFLIGSFFAENNEYKKKIIKSMLSLQDEDWHLIKKFIEKFKGLD